MLPFDSNCSQCGWKGQFLLGDVVTPFERFKCPQCETKLPRPRVAMQEARTSVKVLAEQPETQEDVMQDEDAKEGETRRARQKGLVKLAIGALAAVSIALGAHLFGLARGAEVSLPKWPFAIAAAYALLGAIEVVSGSPAPRLRRNGMRWPAGSGAFSVR